MLGTGSLGLPIHNQLPEATQTHPTGIQGHCSQLNPSEPALPSLVARLRHGQAENPNCFWKVLESPWMGTLGLESLTLFPANQEDEEEMLRNSSLLPGIQPPSCSSPFPPATAGHVISHPCSDDL